MKYNFTFIMNSAEIGESIDQITANDFKGCVESMVCSCNSMDITTNQLLKLD